MIIATQCMDSQPTIAKVSAWPENEQDLKVNQVSFEKYFESLGKSEKKIDPNGLSTRMLKECLAATEDLTTLPFSLKWMDWGMISNGKISTASITFPKIVSESTLSDILEDTVPEKYFLSKEQMEKLTFEK